MGVRDVVEVEQRLRDLGNDPSLVRRKNSLGSLADALTGPDGHLWAKVNVFDAFGEESLTISGEAELVNRLAWLEGVRNFGILLPLLWTWTAIAVGIGAYNDLLSTNDVNDARIIGAPFIEQWAGGFGGRTWITFKWVALIDALLILGVVVLSAIVSYVRKQLDVGIENERDARWNELREVLTDASIHLAAKGYDTPARFSEELTRLWTKYEGVADQMRLASKELERAVGNSETYTRGLRESSENLVGAGQTMAGSAELLHGSVGAMRGDIAALTAAAEGLGADIAQLIAAHQAIGERLNHSMDSTANAASTLERSARSISDQVNETNVVFLEAVRFETAGRDQATANFVQAGAHASELAGSLDKTARQFLDAAATLQDTAARLPEGLERATVQIAASVDQSHHSLNELPDRITEGLRPLDSLGQQLEGLEGGYRGAQAGFLTATEQMAGYSAELRGATEVVAQAMDRFQQTGEAIPTYLQEAAAQIQAAAQACDQVAIAVSAAAALPVAGYDGPEKAPEGGKRRWWPLGRDK